MQEKIYLNGWHDNIIHVYIIKACIILPPFHNTCIIFLFWMFHNTRTISSFGCSPPYGYQDMNAIATPSLLNLGLCVIYKLCIYYKTEVVFIFYRAPTIFKAPEKKKKANLLLFSSSQYLTIGCLVFIEPFWLVKTIYNVFLLIMGHSHICGTKI